MTFARGISRSEIREEEEVSEDKVTKLGQPASDAPDSDGNMAEQAGERMGRRTFVKRAAAVGLSGAVIGAMPQSAFGALASKRNAVPITFWDLPWGTDTYESTANQLVAAFNRANPGIAVTRQSIGWAGHVQVFTTAIAAGKGPDVSTGSSYQGLLFAKQGVVAPVDDIVASWQKSGKANDFYTGVLNAYKYNGHYISLPWSGDIRVLWYRSDILAKAGIKPPTTWGEVRRAAKQLSGGGNYAMAFAGDPFGWQILVSLMINNGGGVFSRTGNVALLTDRNRQAANLIKDMVHDGSISPASVTMTSNDMFNALGQGAAFGWAGGSLENYTPEINAALRPLPMLKSPSGGRGTLHWVEPIMLYSNSQHPAEAKKFISYWMEQTRTLLLDRNGTGNLPVQKSVGSHNEFKSAKWQTVLNGWLPTAKYTSALDPALFPALGAVEPSTALTTLIQDLLSGKDVEPSLQKAQSSLEQVLALNK